jgi:hypothetical protein
MLDILRSAKEQYLADGDELGRERFAYHLSLNIPESSHFSSGDYVFAYLRIYRYRILTHADGTTQTQRASLDLKFQGNVTDETRGPVVDLYGYYAPRVEEHIGEYCETLAFLRFWRPYLEGHERYGALCLVEYLAWLHKKGFRPVPELEDGSIAYPGRRSSGETNLPAEKTSSRSVHSEHVQMITDARQRWADNEARLAADEEARKARESEDTTGDETEAA